MHNLLYPEHITDFMSMRTPILVVTLCILVFAGAWLLLTVTEPREPVVKVVKYVPDKVISQPQTVVIEDKNAEMETLKKEISDLKEQIETQNTRDRYGYRDYSDYYYRDYYDDYYDDRYYYKDRYDDDEWDLEVRVKDDEDGDPIDDARVKVTNGDSEVEYTDNDGEAEFRNLEEDCYDIRVTADDYDSEEDDICLRDDERITIRLDRD